MINIFSFLFKLVFKQNEGASPLPIKALAILSLNLIGISAAANSVYSFVGYMIIDFGIVKTNEEAGDYAGEI